MSESQGLQPGFIIAHSNHLEQLRDLVCAMEQNQSFTAIGK